MTTGTQIIRVPAMIEASVMTKISKLMSAFLREN
jgi:hypothetical protein